MSIEAIKTAVEELSETELREFGRWLDKLRDDAWDRQMEEDFQPGGAGQFLIDEARADIAAGRTRPLQDLLDEQNSRVA